MKNFRIYGKPPFAVAVLHGGPGASGEMAPVARELSQERGVLEPLQTASSVEGQIEELKLVLEEQGDIPVILIGYSWGAWLGFHFAARNPALVRKLILVSSGPFQEKYAAAIQKNRLNRLSPKEQEEVQSLRGKLEDAQAFARFGEIMSQADFYDPLPMSGEALELRPDIYQGVWNGAKDLRRSGELLKRGKQIQCPVVALHGDHDPHPAEGVQKLLSATLKSFRFILLEKCGHTPWMEKQARDEFFRILRVEVGNK
jgi:pimeloyl-ACP methyl ester carboxylesterase